MIMPDETRQGELQDLHSAGITIPAAVVQAARDGLGEFFYRLNGTAPLAGALDHLNTARCLNHAEWLQQFEPLSGKRLLEIGSGYGTTLAVLIHKFGADAFGVEPDGEGFGSSLAASRILLSANGIQPERVVAGVGEQLPFPDASFDIVYSCNVLEHTQVPEEVLREALRVRLPEVAPEWDIVINPRRPAIAAPVEELRREVDRLVAQCRKQ